VDELKLLQEGLIVFCRNQYFFVQVRLIYHCVDTKALGKLLKVHETNSLAGCPFCAQGKGTHRSALDKTVYPGHRILLEEKHYLRYFGKSQICCPPSYYAQEIVYKKECKSIERSRNHFFHNQYMQYFEKNKKIVTEESSERLLKQLVY
jgi:hypothetical protein